MQIGDTYEYKNVVTKEITRRRARLGRTGTSSPRPSSFAGWRPQAYYYMKEHLEGKSSVGTMVNVRHVSPPHRRREIAKAELIAISENGKMYTFKVEA